VSNIVSVAEPLRFNRRLDLGVPPTSGWILVSLGVHPVPPVQDWERFLLSSSRTLHTGRFPDCYFLASSLPRRVHRQVLHPTSDPAIPAESRVYPEPTTFRLPCNADSRISCTVQHRIV
jgi:hypothetical protein